MKAKLTQLERRMKTIPRPKRGSALLWTPDGEAFAVLHTGGEHPPMAALLALIAPDRAEAVAALNPRWLSRAEAEALEREGYALDVVAETPTIPRCWRGLVAHVFGC